MRQTLLNGSEVPKADIPSIAQRTLVTESVLAQIRHWITDNHLEPTEIARKIGCTVGTLRVRCSQYGVSLRRETGCRAAAKLSLTLPIEIRAGLRYRATQIGVSESALATKLIETINRDDLYSAVLDDAAPFRESGAKSPN